MPKSKKSVNFDFKDICHGCLSRGRKLLPIEDYYSLYQKLMADLLMEPVLHKKVPLMCWECHGMLRNTCKFQKRFKQAHDVLIETTLNSKKILSEQLSTLTTFFTNTPNVLICENAIFQDDAKVDIIIDIKNGETQNHEVKVEYEESSDIKEEIYDCTEFNDVKLEVYDDDDGCDETGNEGLFAEDIEMSDIAIKEELSINKKTKKTDGRKPLKYKSIKIDVNDRVTLNKFCRRVKVDKEERDKCVSETRAAKEFLKATFNCQKCVRVFSDEPNYVNHIETYHLETNVYECKECDVRCSTEEILVRHVDGHGYIYDCLVCDYKSPSAGQIRLHIGAAHRIVYECRKCGCLFRARNSDFHKHYKDQHKWFICDYCGVKRSTKPWISRHIRKKHAEHKCKFCKRRYGKYDSMRRHIALHHTKHVTEESYCVECNKQFDNISQYKQHLKMSVIHKPQHKRKPFSCPECSNVYAKKSAMTNHYKHVHLQKTNHYCEKCSRYFLNGFRLRTHIASYHNKIQVPKNKICPYCGRGFGTNRILNNHVRTHTGERPFACAHCSATFAQRAALVSHARAIHKVPMSFATRPKL